MLSNIAPNFLSGFIILEKSLFDKLLSPTNLNFFLEFINNPSINLPSVPEFPASINKLFVKFKFNPFPIISHFLLVNFTFDPNFFIQLIALKTSSDIKRLYAVDFFFDKDAIKTHLIDKLLSPATKIFLSKDFTTLLILKILFIFNI